MAMLCGGVWRCPMARGFELGQTSSCIQMCFVLPLINSCYGIVNRDFLNDSFYYLCCTVLLAVNFLQSNPIGGYYLGYA
jgi:hypothetical protein